VTEGQHKHARGTHSQEETQRQVSYMRDLISYSHPEACLHFTDKEI